MRAATAALVRAIAKPPASFLDASEVSSRLSATRADADRLVRVITVLRPLTTLRPVGYLMLDGALRVLVAGANEALKTAEQVHDGVCREICILEDMAAQLDRESRRAS